MINVQRMAKDIKRLAEETNTILTEIEGMVLMTSISNKVMNTTNITQILEDLRYLVQSDMDKWAFQVQRMLANELGHYKEKGNSYVDNNIKEIQELYMEEEKKEEKETVENEEVILVCPYKISSMTSFITDKIENLVKYMKFVRSPIQTRIFRSPPHYKSLRSRGEQDSDFWKEIATALVDNKNNIETSRNGMIIKMFQGGPPHELFFIAIDNRDQVIIGPNKKTVAMYIVGELEILM